MSTSKNSGFEMTDEPSPASSGYEEALTQFIHLWGEMASNWGINRTMAQIHALLYGSERPLNTDEIMARLDISRGNANMNLRSLTGWSLVEKVRRPGSRKDFYTAKKDVWEITAQIIKERERREIEPVKQRLEGCRDALLEAAGAEQCPDLDERERVFCGRVENLLRLIEVFEGFSRTILPLVEKRDIEKMEQFLRFADALREQVPDEQVEES